MANGISREESALPTMPFGMKAGIFSASMGMVGIADLAGHLGLPGIVLGTIGAVGVTKLSPVAIDFVKERIDEIPEPVRRLVGRRRVRQAHVAEEAFEDEEDLSEYQEDAEEDDAYEEEDDDMSGESEDMAEFMEEWRQIQEATPSIQRVTIDAIVEHTRRNSYWMYVGRNLNSAHHQVEVLDFCRQHIKIIGRSQMGKSSMAAALMEIITRTHDESHVQLCLLDLEHKTSRLFENLPHVATWQGKKLLATNEEEVVEHLGSLLDMLKYRYTLSEAEVERLPLLLIYVEEFLDLKNEFQTRMKVLPKGEERDAAATAYAQLVLAINKIALRGLKVHMQFLLCAQVDYADEDFKKALGQFGIGFSFCVRPTAAQAAGFFAQKLLKENAQSKQKGQAVMEANGEDAIILAPECNLRQRLIDLARSQTPTFRSVPLRLIPNASGTQVNGHLEPEEATEQYVRDEEQETHRNRQKTEFHASSERVRYVPENDRNEPGEPSERVPDAFSPRPGEKMLNDLQSKLLIAFYEDYGDVKKALYRIKNDRGEGLGVSTYYRHACWILDSLGLRKKQQHA